MTAFYGEILGLNKLEDTAIDGWIEFDAGAARLALHAIPREVADRIDVSSPPQPRELCPIKLVFEVDHLATDLKRLESAGVRITRRPWGTYDGIDPEGNIFQVAEASQNK